MSKPIIAIDIDDVLSDSNEAVRQEVNERLGVNLQPDHYMVPGEYWGYYEKVWATHNLHITFDDLSEQSVKDRYLPHKDAAMTLRHLADTYSFVVITSRNEQWKELTEQWLTQYFDGLIDRVVFAGNKEHTVVKSKGEVCADLGAQWLIDDNVEHCNDALRHGVAAVLFGDYGWHQAVPAGLVRCKDWIAVKEFFDERTS